MSIKCHNTEQQLSPEIKNYDHVPDGYTGIVYTCPMHPQVRDIKNTTCPICGMGLEPETISIGSEEDSSELEDKTRRFWISAFLTIPLFIYAMADIILGRPLEAIEEHSQSPVSIHAPA